MTSSQEVKVFTSFCKEPSMYEVFAKGHDLYSTIASMVYNLPYDQCREFRPDGSFNLEGKKRRTNCKSLVLGILYGRGTASVADQIKSHDGPTTKEDIAEAQNLINMFFEKYPMAKAWIDKTHSDAREYGYVEDLWGRRRRLPDINLPVYEFKHLDSEGGVMFNPLIGAKPREAKIDNKLIEQYTTKLNKARSKDQRDSIAKEGEKDGIKIICNSGYIAQAERQSVNARIQGCLGGDTRIQTQEYGIVKISQVVNQKLNIWDGHDWTIGEILHSGLKKKCVIKFTTSQEMVCSPNHKFLTINTKGTEIWKSCEELKSGDRILINSEYKKSNFKYTSDRKDKLAYNSHNYYLDDIKNSFELGRVLGRLASDGSYHYPDDTHPDKRSGLSQIIAEHEFNIIPILNKYMEPWQPFERIKPLHKNRSQKMCHLTVTCKSLIKEIKDLDIKHSLNDNIFKDTELLRGFISGFFDGDGGISGDKIILTFGKQYNFLPLMKDMQKALTFFGIKSSIHIYSHRFVLSIRKSDSKRFAEIIGFINTKKQTLAENITTINDGHTFNHKNFLIVKNINKTEEYINMYDVCNTERGYFIADGLVTHNSSATMTKLALRNMYRDPELNALDFHPLIPVHDEIIGEAPVWNIEKARDRMSKIMMEAGLPECDIPMKVDCDVFTCWYSDVMEAHFIEDYNKSIDKGLSEAEAMAEVKEEYNEFEPEYIERIITENLANK